MSLTVLHNLSRLAFWSWLLLIVAAASIALVAMWTEQPLLTTWTVQRIDAEVLPLAVTADRAATTVIDRGALSITSGSGSGMHSGLRLLDVIINGALVALSLWALQQMLADLRRGRPFMPASSGRLRSAALALLLVPCWQLLGARFWPQVMLHDLDAMRSGWLQWTLRAADGELLRLQPDWSAELLLPGIVMLLLSEIFRAGNELQRDVDGMV